MSRFYDINPSPENCWRTIVLFGQNVASYKFALAKALLEINPQRNGLIKLEELALPFANHICAYLAGPFHAFWSMLSSFFLPAKPAKCSFDRLTHFRYPP
jgi:hypothetical protein